MRFIVFALSAVALFAGCASSPPKGVEAVTGFELGRYLGTWYEIARLDHSFERDLNDVTAEYAQVDEKMVSVRNRGFNEKTNEWEDIEGRAKFAGDPTVGSLKVSFFGPFFAGYHIIALDKENYQWAMVTGPTRNYLWILARQPQLDEAIYNQLLEQADSLGYDVEGLIEVSHTRTE